MDAGRTYRRRLIAGSFVLLAAFAATLGLSERATGQQFDLGISLSATVSTSSSCGTSSSITVASGTTVYFCYTATNTGGMSTPPLEIHTLTDTVFGTYFSDSMTFSIPAGGSASFVSGPYVVNAMTSNAGTWSARTGIGDFPGTVSDVSSTTVNVEEPTLPPPTDPPPTDPPPTEPESTTSSTTTTSTTTTLPAPVSTTPTTTAEPTTTVRPSTPPPLPTTTTTQPPAVLPPGGTLVEVGCFEGLTGPCNAAATTTLAPAGDPAVPLGVSLPETGPSRSNVITALLALQLIGAGLLMIAAARRPVDDAADERS